MYWLSSTVMLKIVKGNVVQNEEAKEIINSIKFEIQQQSKKAKGFKSLKNFKNIIYLTTGKLNFSLINSEYNKIQPKDLNYYFAKNDIIK
jgi:hypothetical protein